VSLYETTLALLSYQITGLGSADPGRHGTAFVSIAPYRVYETEDGEVMIAAGTTSCSPRCRVLALRVSRRSGSDQPDRVAHRRSWTRSSRAARAGRDGAARGARRRGKRRPFRTWPRWRHPQTDPDAQALHTRVPTAHGRAVSIDGERVGHRAPPPDLGADTDAVLREAGYSVEEIGSLADQGIVRVSP
jgi:crotonobetainyl-CoA:carnitine CoA-transferase CaiB-like acyl-CoA transferase